jgi:amino acid transporter
MTDSTRETLADRETELDLLQRRLHNKTSRAARVIQFNALALSLVVGLTQLVGFSEILSSPTVIAGVLILIVSTTFSVAGITLGGDSFKWVRNRSRDEVPEIETALDEYRNRNRHLSLIMPVSLFTGGSSIAILLIGILWAGKTSETFPLWILGVVLVVFLAVALYAGFGLSRGLDPFET